MKTFTRFVFTLSLLLIAGQVTAQNTWTDDLDEVIGYAQDIKTDAKANRTALRTLAIDYFQLNNPNPNVQGYLAAMTALQSNIESNSDEIIYYAGQAAQKNPNVNPANLQNWGSQIEAREDYVQIESQNLAAAIAANNRPAARTANRAIRANLADQIAFSNLIINEATQLKTTAVSYDVRIELVDNNGNAIIGSTGLQGYYAYNAATNSYTYPDYYNPDEFIDLAAGTYTFGAYDGYFDGASSNTVTLSQNLVGNDGYIVVQLVYWSE